MKNIARRLSVLRLVFCLAAGGAELSCSAVSGETLDRYARAGDMYAQGRFAETVGLLEGTANFSPALALRAKAEYFSGAIEKAEKTCRLAIRRRPSAFEARLYLARILRERGDAAGAERVAESLLTDNPQDIRVLRFLSALALEGGRGGEALALLDQAAELAAESAMVLLDRARLRWIAGRGAEALEDLDRARVMLPWDTPLSRSIENLESRIKEALQ
jgi:tetratricopeptide (TPR) repeat protein